jgi:hypothetical protein
LTNITTSEISQTGVCTAECVNSPLKADMPFNAASHAMQCGFEAADAQHASLTHCGTHLHILVPVRAPSIWICVVVAVVKHSIHDLIGVSKAHIEDKIRESSCKAAE